MKLKKMLLINWLYYEKTLLSFEDIVFLSGKTGEGKSALIDAMQIILLGKTDNSLFNKSANDKTTRDLMGYLKGKYKNGTFKRDKGSFSSHLCMEFQDDKNQSYCFGIVFDCSGSTRGDMNYRFYMMNQPIPDHLFLQEDTLLGKTKRVYDIHAMKKFLDGFQDRGCRMFTTNTDYRGYFKQRMLIKDERFFDVFKMAVAYTPMMNISEFIVKNICHEEENLNLEEMQEEIQDYRQMKEQLEAVQRKKIQLSEIHEQYMESLQGKENLDAKSIEQEAAEYQLLVLEQQQVQQQYDRSIKESSELQKQSKETDELYTKLESKLEELKDARKDNAADILERKIQNCQNQWDLQNKDVCEVKQQVLQKGTRLSEQLDCLEDIEDEEDIALSQYQLSSRKLDVRRSMNQAEKLASFDLPAYLTLKDHLADIDQQLSNAKLSILQKMNQEEATLHALKETRQQLENGKKPYPRLLVQFRTELQERLSAMHGKQIDVSILADHITIKNQRYADAIEGYIRHQKLNLIVEEQYFMDAYRIYKMLKGPMKLHTYSIVDHTKVKLGKRSEAMSLYDCVEVDQEDLKPYVEYLLGRAICCEDEAMLREYPVSITPDCMLYSGYAVTHMNPEHYKVPFIGAGSLEKQLLEVTHQIKEHEELFTQVSSLQKLVQQVNLPQFINDDFIRQLESGIEKAKSLEALEEEMKELKKAQTPESLQELMIIDEKIKKYDEEKRKVLKTLVSLKSKENDIDKILYDTNQRMETLQEVLDTRSVPERGIPDTIAQIETFAQLQQRKQQIDEEIRKLRSKVEIGDVELLAMKRRYNESFRISLNPSFDCDDYEREYEKHSQNIVEGYIEKCHLAQEKAYECFQNNFFSALNSKIDNVKTQIDRLNRSIKRHQFGRSQYEFVCTCNEDYREYYDLITNKELNGHNLLNTHVYEENEELIHELFDKISALSSMQDPKLYHELEKEVKMLSRFTTYLKFDILENGNSLRATIGSSSGGETQTPFYVAVLVSLFSVYDGPNGGLQLAIFDEAFDKMDNERIEECINLLKSLGFQAIIVTPTDKISNLSKSADMTLIAATDEKNGQRVSAIQQWSQKETLHG